MSQNIERSIRDLREMDTLASGKSPIHAVSAGAKLLVTVVYILTVVSFDKYRMSSLLFMIFYPAVLFAVSGISVSTCFYKLRFMLPLVLAVGIFNPIMDRTPAAAVGSFTITAGMISMLTLMMKGVFSLTASFLLMATTRIEALCGALRKIHVPSMPVTLLLLTYRAEGNSLFGMGVLSGTAPAAQHGPGGGTARLHAPEGVSRGIPLCAGPREFGGGCAVCRAVVCVLCRSAMREPDTASGVGFDEVTIDDQVRKCHICL